ncbi:hypothetical protein WG908_08790 [Sphingobium sp. AN641]|uniref:hypothetical protein n=1 Tax=Sphingobium sp. AN641 TaxID=3133443 RepID=UPI0030C15FD6
MGKLSIGKAWEESVAFVARESTLLLPVALLFVALPSLMLEQLMPPGLSAWLQAGGEGAMPPVPLGFWAGALMSMILMWFGSLALFALALRPGISVGEALRLSIARLPVLIGAALLIMAGIFALVLLVALVAVMLASLSKPLGAAVVALFSTALVVAAFFGGVRMILLNPVIIDGTMGVRMSILRAWHLTQGHFWRLLAFLVLLLMLLAIVSSAAQTVVGVLAGIVAGPATAKLAGGIAGALVTTLVQLYMLVMIARLYRQAQDAA